MIIHRRGLIIGAMSALAAPAIVRADSIMRVKSFRVNEGFVTLHFADGQSVRIPAKFKTLSPHIVELGEEVRYISNRVVTLTAVDFDMPNMDLRYAISEPHSLARGDQLKITSEMTHRFKL